jgi:outer membrane protein TolC
VDRSARAAVASTAAAALAAPTATVSDAFASLPDAARAPAAVALDQDTTLRLATTYSRKLQARRDALVLKGVDLLAARRDFGPLLEGTLAYLREDDGSDSADLKLGVRQVLPWGGSLSAGGTAGRRTTHTAPGSNTLAYTTSGSLTLEQPLLAGAGREASHEPLTQAERNLVYELRGFALERQDFAIGILRAYYELLLRQTLVDNTRLNVEQNTFLRQRSEALFQVGVVNALDVMRAQQQEFTALNQLQAAATDVEAATARFLVELGLPVATSVTLAGHIPEPRAVTLDEGACVALAMSRRLDLQTVRDQVEDAERRARIARRGMLPALDATATARVSGSSPDGFGNQSYEGGDDLSAGLALALPLDKRPDRYTLKRAELGVAAARRAAAEKRDTVQVEIEESFRRLLELRTSADIAYKSMEIARRRNDYALLRFKNGEVSNRDVVEAQTELLNARNAHARALVQYELKRIQLLRDIGLLDVAADGTLVEPADFPAPETSP